MKQSILRTSNLDEERYIISTAVRMSPLHFSRLPRTSVKTEASVVEAFFAYFGEGIPFKDHEVIDVDDDDAIGVDQVVRPEVTEATDSPKVGSSCRSSRPCRQFESPDQNQEPKLEPRRRKGLRSTRSREKSRRAREEAEQRYFFRMTTSP